MIKLVIFDFDGTLTPQQLDGNVLLSNFLGKEKEFKQIVKRYAAREITGEEGARLLGKAYKGITIREVAKVRQLMKLRSGVLDTFYKLRKIGIKIAINTGEANQMMRDMLKILKPDHFDGVDAVFDENGIFTGKIEWDMKYKSELTHHLMTRYNLKPNEVMGVGDTWYDEKMVPKGGTFVSIGNHDLSDLAKFHINEIPEILDIIEKIK